MSPSEVSRELRRLASSITAHNRPIREYVSQTLDQVLREIPVFDRPAMSPVCDRTDLDLDWASRRP